MITKATITYSDGQTKTFEGENLVLGSLPHSLPPVAEAPVEVVPVQPVVEEAPKKGKKKA